MSPNSKFITCQICGYHANRKNHEKRKFMARFPLDEDRCKSWVMAVGKEDLGYVPIEKLHTLKYLCGDHFQKNNFNKKGNRLKKTAIPKENLMAAPLSEDMMLEFPLHINMNYTTDFDTERRFKNAGSQIGAIPGLNWTGSSDHAYCKPTSLDEDATRSSIATNVPDDSISGPFPLSNDHLSDADEPIEVPTESDEIKSLRREFRGIAAPLSLQLLKEKVKLIDNTAAWLLNENIPEETKAIGVEVIFANKMSYPEIANHPILLQMLIKPKDESGGIFNEDLFQSKMKPFIVKLFKSNEARVRLKLLDCFSDYVHTFTEEELKLLLLPEILKGMQDVNKTIVRATLLCLAHLVEILGPHVVIGGTRQELFVFSEVGPREEIVESAENKENRNEADNGIDAENRVKKRRRKRDIKESYEEGNDDSANESDSESDTKNRVNKTRKKRDIKESYEEGNNDSANESDSKSDTNNRFNKTRKKRDIKESVEESNDGSANETDSEYGTKNRVNKTRKKRDIKESVEESNDGSGNETDSEYGTKNRVRKTRKMPEIEASDEDLDELKSKPE